MTISNEHKELSFSPLDAILRMVDYWWIVLLFSLGGAGLCYLISLMFAPVYESQAVVGIGFDYRETGVLTDIELDRALTSAGDIITSPEVVERVIQAAGKMDIPISQDDFSSVFFKERQYFNWILRVRYSDPHIAQQLAEIWLAEASINLDDALLHAIRVRILDQENRVKIDCLQQVVVKPSHAYCNLDNLGSMVQDIDTISKMLLEERDKSKGLLSGMSISTVADPSLSASPVLYGKGWFLIVGGAIGFLLSVVLINRVRFPFPGGKPDLEK